MINTQNNNVGPWPQTANDDENDDDDDHGDDNVNANVGLRPQADGQPAERTDGQTDTSNDICRICNSNGICMKD